MYMNPKLGLQMQGMALNNRSYSDFEKIITALKEDVPVFDMSVKDDNGKRIPLDHFLSQMKNVNEVDGFFTGASLFDIWQTLPLGLTEYPEKSHTTKEEAPKLLHRFNQYTWSDKPNVRKAYMTALRSALWVADTDTYKGWRIGFNDCPNLGTAMHNLLNSQYNYAVISNYDLLKQPSAIEVRVLADNIRNIEFKIKSIPEENMFHYFTRKGREKEKQREELIQQYVPAYKSQAAKAVKAISSLGTEYRHFCKSEIPFFDPEFM